MEARIKKNVKQTINLCASVDIEPTNSCMNCCPLMINIRHINSAKESNTTSKLYITGTSSTLQKKKIEMECEIGLRFRH
jgi:hypothetical protein